MIHNDKPRLDTDGNIMDVHDGNTLLVDGTYFYYGAEVGLFFIVSAKVVNSQDSNRNCEKFGFRRKFVL